MATRTQSGLKLGDKVRRADANGDSIPAYRDMRGTIVAITSDGGLVRVCWGLDDTDVMFRNADTVCTAE